MRPAPWTLLPLLALLAFAAVAATASADHRCRTYPVDLPVAEDASALEVCFYDSHDLEGWVGTVTGGRAITAAAREHLALPDGAVDAAAGAGVTQAYYSSSIGSYLLTRAGGEGAAGVRAAGTAVGASATAHYEQEQSTFAQPCTDRVRVSAGTTVTGTESHEEARPCEQALPLLPARPEALPGLP